MTATHTIREQIRRNAVALISLAIALSSLSYNTWRNETTEHQRNLRHAAFEIVQQLGELQSRADQLQYGENADSEVWTAGWGNVLTIQTIGQLLPAPVPDQSDQMVEIWGAHFEALESDDPTRRKQAGDAISAQVMIIRGAVLDVLHDLD